MKIIDLVERTDIQRDAKAMRRFNFLQELLEELKTLDIHDDLISWINIEVDKINNFNGSVKILAAELGRITNRLLSRLEKKHKLVKKNHYRDLWMAVGMSVYGLPIGVALSAAIDTWGFIAIGLPIGMIIGMAIGSAMDKKAESEGRILKSGSNAAR